MNGYNRYLCDNERKLLLDTAHQSIVYGVTETRPMQVELDHFPKSLTSIRATFVTLTINGKLRGCMGTLDAFRPLLCDVSDNAYSAAFSDPRFDAVTSGELDGLSFHISILSPANELVFASEQDLINQLQPNIDGLILQEGQQRATFLPAVWESLSDPSSFLNHLKQKAGLPYDYWSDQIRIFRYETESVE